MKSKSSLALMELVIMILVFAFTAAFCLMAFVWADTTSEEQVARDSAIIEAQNMAELLKNSHGKEIEKAEAVYFDGNWEETDGENHWEYVLTVEPEKEEQEFLGGATVLVSDREQEEIFALTVKWQEVASNEG